MATQFPMPEPTVPVKPLTSFKSLSFDIYGTLINWENSIVQRLEPLRKHAPTKSANASLGDLFHAHEVSVQAQFPSMKYDEVLAQAYLRLATELGITSDLKSEAKAFGSSIGEWPAFPDTVDAMRRLGKYYKLIVLSNVDKSSFARTNAGPLNGLEFWRIYTAQDIGSYKPDLKNFEYLLKNIDAADKSEGGDGIGKEEDLHVAQSLFHDHVPAKKMGMSSVWINRRAISGGGLTGGEEVFARMHREGEVGYGWRFGSLGEFADEVERQWNK